MEKSGYVNTNTEYDSYFWVRWSQDSQSIAENYTIINWSCGVTPGHKFGSNAIKMSSVYINGQYVYAGGTYSNFTDYQEHTLASGKLKIPHDADGTKTFYISSFTGWLWENHNYSANATPHTLESIPRQATITAAPDFTDLENPTITYSNPAGNAVTDLKACISFTGAKDDIAYRNISKTGGTSNTNITYQFPLTEAERDVLRNNTGIDRDVIFYVRSIIGGVTYYSTLKRKLTIAESEATKPTVRMSVSLNNGSLDSKFDGLYIQGKSKVDVSLNADGQYGASIQSYSAVVDGKTYDSPPFTSDVIQNSGSVKITGYAKDSRKFTGSNEQTVNVIEYSKPLVIPIGSENAIQCYRSDMNGNRTGNSETLWFKVKRSYHSVSGKNTCRLQWRWKVASEEWPKEEDWDDLLSPNSATDEYNDINELYYFDLNKAYTIQIRAIDDIGEHDTKTLEIPTRDVALHLGKGGKNVAVGTYCDYSEDHTFYSEWKAIFDKDVVVGGDIYIGEMTLADYIRSVIN